MARSRDDDDDEDFDDEDEAPRRSKKKGDGIPEGTPRVYVHKKCKGETEMPAKEIRKYLENPFEMDEAPKTYCAECEKDVPLKDCTWVETKQNAYEYIEDLRAEMVISGNDPRAGGPTYPWWMPLGVAVGAGVAFGFGTKKMEGVGVWGGVAAAVIGGAGAAVYFWFQFQQEKKGSEEWNRKLVARYYKRHPEAKKPSKKKRREDDDDDE
ncbi:hypothetical protein [Limnoglobus roseus]|uniref:Uncharacterized protein n=1 Tax=Limnoglobus roseus TaxID=2598579 RepID=A0A5C1A5Y1_9BACT|nr:hypothetical protein [Limnoglobus roseus]QEL14521.1 hypothetical protein PX52LOC_01411 [Limnoglobus roseus]